ncbi:MAG: TolC family protein [Bryobacteraceae bacterium]
MLRKAGLMAALSALAVFAQDQRKVLTLAEAQATALRLYPAIASASLTAQAAGEQVRQAKSALLPLMSGNFTNVGAQADTSVSAGNITTSSLVSRAGASGLTVSQLITDFGRTNRLIESSSLRAQAQKQRVALSRAQVLLVVSQAYFRAQRSRSILEVARATVGARRIVLRQVQALADSSLKSTLDVSFAEVNLSDAELTLLRTENQANAALAELSAALGSPGQQALELTEEPLPAPIDSDAQSAIQNALSRRPDLAGLTLNRDSIARFAEAEKRLALPTISFLGTAGAVPYRETKLAGTYGAAGVNVSIPVFNGHLFSARRGEAEFRAQAAGKHVEELMLQIARDVKVAWLEADTAAHRMDLAARLLTQAGKSLRLAQSRYDLGLSTIVEFSQAQLNQTAAEMEQASSKYDYQIAVAGLSYQTGAFQ